MDSDDEVVQERDIYLTSSVASSLYIFQYPLKYSPLAESINDSCKIKLRPSHHMFEIERRVDTRSSNYDKRKSEQIAYCANNAAHSNSHGNSRNDKEELLFPDKIVNKQKMNSSEIKPSLSSYAIALLKSDPDEIHLTPINSVIKFHSNLKHFDKSEIHMKAGKKGNIKSDAESSQDEGEPSEDVKVITSRFAGPDEDKIKKARERSYHFHQQQIEKDSWVDIRYSSSESKKAESIRESLVCNHLKVQGMNSSSNNDSNSQASSIINSIEDWFAKKVKIESNISSQGSGQSSTSVSSSSTSASTTTNDISKSDHNLSLSYIKAQSLSDQVCLLLCNCKVISFDTLMSFLTGSCDTSSALRSLQMYASLIQGNWVVKSQELYKRYTMSPLTGIPVEILVRSRDLLLWYFSQSRSIYKADISEKVNIPQEDLVEMLSQIALFNKKTKCWDFLLPTDESFIKNNPEIVKRQTLLLSNHYTYIERCIENAKVKVEEGQSQMKTPLPVNNRKRRASSRRNSTASMSADDNETELISNVLNESINHPVSVQNGPVKVKLEPRSPTKSPPSAYTKIIIANGIKDRKKPKTAKLAVLDVSPTVGLSPTVEEKRELVKVIQEKLKSCYCVTINELKSVIYEKLSMKYSLDASDEVIESCVSEAGGIKVQNKWPQNSVQQNLFAFIKFGDNLDILRETLIEMFADQTRVRITHFKEKVRDKFGEKNCDNYCKKLLKDYCVFKASMYYLKGTVDSS